MLILRESVDDEAIKVIATINKIAVETQADDYNPYLALKNFTEATKNTTSLTARPFGFQSKILKLDEAILDLDAGKSNASQSKATEYHNLYPADESVNVINAAARTVNKTGREVVKRIEQMFEANPIDVGLALTLIQLRMSTGNITGSISTLELLFSKLEPEKRYQPGLVGLLVALYEHQGRKQHVRKILSEASEWWKQSPQPVRQFVHIRSSHSNTVPRTLQFFAPPPSPSSIPRTPPNSPQPENSTPHCSQPILPTAMRSPDWSPRTPRPILRKYLATRTHSRRLRSSLPV